MTDYQRDEAPAAPTLAESMARLHQRPAPAWARPIINEFDLKLARERKWRDALHAKIRAGELVEADALVRADAAVALAENQWNNVVNIAIQRRRHEFAEIVLPMLEKNAGQWAAAEDRRQKKMGRLLDALAEVRKEEGTQQTLFGEMLALRKSYEDVLVENHDTPTDYINGTQGIGLRVGEIVTSPRIGTQLQFVPNDFVWPARPAPPAPPAAPTCVDKRGTTHLRHAVTYVRGFGKQGHWECQRCEKIWPASAFPLPDNPQDAA